MKKRRIFFQVTVFLMGFVLLWIGFTRLFEPKFVFHSKYLSPELESWELFYEQEKDSLDAVYVGSSHVYNAINPVVIYENMGFTGYTLASSDQDMAVSYYYIKEAIRTQHPQIVFLDSFYLSKGCYENDDNYKRSFDYMKWSGVKKEAIESWMEYLPDERMENRVLTLLDYHTRWTDIREEDFRFEEMKNSVCGYAPILSRQMSERELYYFDEEPYEMPDITREYFDKIVTLCRENGVHLTLITIPASFWTKGYGDTARQLAEDYQIGYIDFNAEAEFKAMDINIYNDFRDPNHMNIFGADKVSKRLAEHMSGMALEPKVKSDKTLENWSNYGEKWHEYEDELIRIDNEET